jgi:predicted site-specific integrase-resolvase
MKTFEPFAEWAAKNGVRRSTGYELIRTGQLDHVRLGKRIMVASDALERLFERQRAAASGLRIVATNHDPARHRPLF